MNNVIELNKFKAIRDSNNQKNVFSELCQGIIDDERLSDKATIFLLYILNNIQAYRCGDDPISYYINTTDSLVMKRFGYSKTRLKNLIRELKTSGYITLITQERFAADENDQFLGWVSKVEVKLSPLITNNLYIRCQ